MMDTVLNLGLNDSTVEGLAKLSGDRRFALDSYRRFITMYSDVVLGVHHHTFEDILERHKDDEGYVLDTEMSAKDWDTVIKGYKAAIKRELGRDFPQDPREQLQGAIDAVFGSWMNERAIVYRRLNDIPAAWGTAVNVQAMVFGNMGETSVLRRVPHQCPRRRCCGGYPHTANANKESARRDGRRCALYGRSFAGCLQTTRRNF